MIIDVTVDLTDVNLMPSSEVEEVAQNVQVILATLRSTVPMDRDFGIDGRFLDEPVNAAQARAIAEITSTIHTQEPRAKVKKVLFQSDISGYMGIRVRIEI